MGLSDKSSMEIRLFMASHGWDSHDKITKDGWGDDYGYGIWFERCNWHGRNTYALTGHHVCFHRHANNLNEIDHIVRICAEQALKSYEEYIDCIPFQNARNETAKDIMYTNWEDERTFFPAKQAKEV